MFKGRQLFLFPASAGLGLAGVQVYYIDLHYVILLALKFLVLLDVKNIEPPHIGLGNVY